MSHAVPHFPLPHTWPCAVSQTSTSSSWFCPSSEQRCTSLPTQVVDFGVHKRQPLPGTHTFPDSQVTGVCGFPFTHGVNCWPTQKSHVEIPPSPAPPPPDPPLPLAESLSVAEHASAIAAPSGNKAISPKKPRMARSIAAVSS